MNRSSTNVTEDGPTTDGGGIVDVARDVPPSSVSGSRAVLDRVPTGATLRQELAAAARSRGSVSSVRDDIRRLRTSVRDIDVPQFDIRAERQRLAEAIGEEERLRERIAAARGKV